VFIGADEIRPIIGVRRRGASRGPRHFRWQIEGDEGGDVARTIPRRGGDVAGREVAQVTPRSLAAEACDTTKNHGAAFRPDIFQLAVNMIGGR